MIQVVAYTGKNANVSKVKSKIPLLIGDYGLQTLTQKWRKRMAQILMVTLLAWIVDAEKDRSVEGVPMQNRTGMEVHLPVPGLVVGEAIGKLLT